MPKELTQDWLDWIFENIQRGCDRKELLDILLKEGFDPQLCKIALGYELSKNEIKNKQEKVFLNPKNFAISADQIRDVSAEIYEIEGFLNDDECNLLINKIKSKFHKVVDGIDKIWFTDTSWSLVLFEALEKLVESLFVSSKHLLHDDMWHAGRAPHPRGRPRGRLI